MEAGRMAAIENWVANATQPGGLETRHLATRPGVVKEEELS